MPHFHYHALSSDGQSHKGQLEAMDQAAAIQQLQRRQLSPVELNEGQRSIGLSKWLKPKLSDDVVLLTRQFSTLLKTGIPISEALEALALELEDKPIHPILLDLIDRVLQGQSLHRAMSEHPDAFGTVYLGLIKVGETSGHMSEVLAELSSYLSDQAQLKKKLSGALTYPLVLCGVGSLVVGILVTTVIPTIAGVLEEGGQQLPPSTQALMALSDLVRAAAPWAIVLLPCAVFGFRWILKDPKRKRTWQNWQFAWPMIGPLHRKGQMARFSMTFSIMLRSGVPALEALETLENATQNLALRSAIATVKEGIIGGKDISAEVKSQSIFPPLMSFMISMGEKSGKLDEVLTGVSEHYREEIEHEITKFTKAFEPIMIVAMAVVIGTIVYSVVSAILEMSNVSQA